MNTPIEKLVALFDEIRYLVDEGDITTEEFNEELGVMLDLLNQDDFFGTEGQLDPRGDKRNN